MDCAKKGGYSYCQQYYTFVFNSTSLQCQPFKRQPCPVLSFLLTSQTFIMRAILERLSPPNSRSSFTDETTNRLNRFDRLPFMLDRWRGMVSIGVFITEKEIDTLSHLLFRFISKPRIVYAIYVQKDITKENTPFYTYPNGTVLYYPQGMYPLNMLRDLSIESISTTHFLLIDADVFLSRSMKKSIDGYRDLLSNHRNTLVMPLFDYLNHTHLDRCFAEGLCDELCCMFIKSKDQVESRA